MRNDILADRKKFSTAQKIVIGIALSGLIGYIALLFDAVQIFVVSFAEKAVLHRNFVSPLYVLQQRLKFYSFMGIVSCVMLGALVLFFPQKAKIEGFLSRLAHKKCWGIPVKNIITDIPFVVISFVFVLYLVKNIFLATGITGVDTIVLLAAILIHCGLSFIIYRKRNINPLPHLVFCYGILIVSLLLSSAIFDYSWDGQAYHQVAAQQLKNGWNPFYSNLPETSVFVWNNHYPKFTELFGSIFLSVEPISKSSYARVKAVQVFLSGKT